MSFNVNDIRANLALDGARPTQFMVEITNPFDGATALKAPFLVKASSIPASNLGLVEIPYFGRPIKLAGDRTYDNWGVRVINDEDFVLRDSFERWHALINTPTGNVRDEDAAGLNYKSQAIVSQFGKTGSIIRRYRFDGIFPLSVGEIALDWGAVNTVEEFTVIFAVDKWVPLPSSTGDGGGDS
jgi:hypothetical protein